MNKFKTWKQLQKIYRNSTTGPTSLELFFKEEIPDSRRITSIVVSEKPLVNLAAYRSNILEVSVEKIIKGSHTSS